MGWGFYFRATGLQWLISGFLVPLMMIYHRQAKVDPSMKIHESIVVSKTAGRQLCK
jgi:hypothetical protein